MASRRLEDLHPSVHEKALQLLELAELEGLPLLIYCTLRDNDEQSRLFRQGRPFPIIAERARYLEELGRSDLAKVLIDVGPQYERLIVTHAGPGQSLHNYGFAFDAVPMRDGKPVWGTHLDADRAVWEHYGALVERVGLEWAGRWTSFREFPHAQQPGIQWRDLIREGG